MSIIGDMGTIAVTRERPLDLFVKAIGAAERGIRPVITIEDALVMTNLTSPQSDGWVMEDRMLGGPPQLLGHVIIEHFILRWKGLTVGRLERKVKARESNESEEEVAKLMTGVLVVHQIRGEELCISGKTKINTMNRVRPDLVLKVLEDIRALESQFPTPHELDEYKRRVLLSAADSTYIP